LVIISYSFIQAARAASQVEVKSDWGSQDFGVQFIYQKTKWKVSWCLFHFVLLKFLWEYTLALNSFFAANHNIKDETSWRYFFYFQFIALGVSFRFNIFNSTFRHRFGQKRVGNTEWHTTWFCQPNYLEALKIPSLPM